MAKGPRAWQAGPQPGCRPIVIAGAAWAAILRKRLEVWSFNPQQMTSVAERANNLRRQIPEVALLCGVGYGSATKYLTVR